MAEAYRAQTIDLTCLGMSSQDIAYIEVLAQNYSVAGAKGAKVQSRVIIIKLFMVAY